GTELDDRLGARLPAPRPEIAKPEVRQNVQWGCFRAAVERFDANANVFRIELGVLNHDVEVTICVENPRVEKLELESLARAAAVFADEPTIRKLALRVLVEEAHVGMRRRVIEVEVVLLDVFTMVTFRRRQSEEAFLEDRVLAVPEGRGKD